MADDRTSFHGIPLTAYLAALFHAPPYLVDDRLELEPWQLDLLQDTFGVRLLLSRPCEGRVRRETSRLLSDPR